MRQFLHRLAGIALAGMVILGAGTFSATAQNFLQVFEQNSAQKQVQNLVQVAPQNLLQNLAQSSVQNVSQNFAQNSGQCLDNRAINNARANGRILPLVDILRLAGIARNSNILSVRVCRIAGQPHYLIDILRPNGMAQQFVLRATDGTPYIAG